MAETLVENQVCNSCGAEVREGALFCYNCGGAVASEINVAKTDQAKRLDKISPRKKISKENTNGTEAKQSETVQKQPVREIPFAETTAKPIEKPKLQEEVKLQSAAAIRGKSKIVQPKRVEVVWEEHENTTNVWFILAAVALTILAAVILFLAIRMK